MKNLKKTVMLIIALLPIMVVIIYALTNMGTQSKNEIINFGEIEIQSNDDIMIITYEDGTLSQYILEPMIGITLKPGLYQTVIRFSQNLSENAGIPSTALVITTISYLLYIAVIELLMLVIDIVMFVPRKCSEIFR